MPKSKDFAQGLAGVPKGPYGAAGFVVGEILNSDSRVAEGYGGVVGSLATDDEKRSQFTGRPYEGPVMWMTDGSVAWSVPWAILYDTDNNSYWLDSQNRVASEAGGTVSVDLAKTGGFYFISQQAIRHHQASEFGHYYADSDHSRLVRLYQSRKELVRDLGAQLFKHADIKALPKLLKVWFSD